MEIEEAIVLTLFRRNKITESNDTEQATNQSATRAAQALQHGIERRAAQRHTTFIG